MDPHSPLEPFLESSSVVSGSAPLIPEVLESEDDPLEGAASHEESGPSPSEMSGLPVAAPGPRLTAAQLQPLLDRFVEEKGINCAPDTQRLAGTALTRFAEYWTGSGQGLPYDVQLIVGFRDFLQREQLAVKTQELYLSAVRNFGTWLKASGITQWNPAQQVRGPKTKEGFRKQPLTLTEVGTLMNTLDESTPEGLRNKTIIYLLLKTGMREIEVVRANVEDYQATPDGHILRVQGKGRHDKTEFVVILPEVQVWLERYLATRLPLDGGAPLFLTMGKRHGHRLAPRTLRALIFTALKMANVKRPVVTGHSLRHTAATMSLNGGAPVTAVRDMLRHASMKQTNIYVHTMNRVKEGGERFITQY